MRYFYDCEFLEDGETIELISIGIVAEDGREYYAVNRGLPGYRLLSSPWLMDNVVPSLPRRISHRAKDGTPNQLEWDRDHPDFDKVKLRSAIADEVRGFLLAEGTPELWADYGAYDHVVLCQLWGSMVGMPKGMPMFTNDIQQEALRLGVDVLPVQESGLHNALADARHCWKRWAFLQDEREGYPLYGTDSRSP